MKILSNVAIKSCHTLFSELHAKRGIREVVAVIVQDELQQSQSKEPKVRLAYLVTHPIQYQAPLLRRIAAEPGIDLTVFFCSDFSLQSYFDPCFGKTIAWDVPLTGGYRHEILPAVGRQDRLSFWRPFNYGLARRLSQNYFDVLWVHGYNRWFHWLAMAWAKSRGLKVLVRDEATLISASRHGLKRLAKQIFFLILKNLVDGFLAIGTLNAEYYRSYSIAPARIFQVPYAVDNRFFREKARAASREREQLRQELGLEPGRPIILYASKLSKIKRPADLLEAYIQMSPDPAREPHPYLLFIGDGDQREILEARAGTVNWSSIKFLGFKNQTELPRYYDLCDVLVLPSVFEPWGLVINEAMNAGRAVVVSDQVGCGPDLVKPGENGYVFKTGDIANLRQSLTDILSNFEKCEAMGQKSLEIINKWGIEEDIAGLKQALAYILETE
jgi:glycosyltransferase involved in cell wall biosynthesis